MGPREDYLCFPWFGPMVCQSSCPFHSYDCRLPLNGLWSAPGSVHWWVKPDPSTSLPLSVWLRLLCLSSSYWTYRRAVIWLTAALHSGSDRALLPSLFLPFIFLCPLPIYFICACCSLHLLTNHTTARKNVLTGPSGNMPTRLVSLGRAIIC